MTATMSPFIVVLTAAVHSFFFAFDYMVENDSNKLHRTK